MKKILYVDMDNVLVDFPSAFPRLPSEILHEYKENPDEIHGIFGLMEPKPHAVEAYKELAELFDCYVLSTSPWLNPSAWSDKLLWIQKYLGQAAHKRLILTHHKNLNIGHYLVDDRDRNGADKFSGELIRFGEEPFPDWPAVVRYLRDCA